MGAFSFHENLLNVSYDDIQAMYVVAFAEGGARFHTHSLYSLSI